MSLDAVVLTIHLRSMQYLSSTFNPTRRGPRAGGGFNEALLGPVHVTRDSVTTAVLQEQVSRRTNHQLELMLALVIVIHTPPKYVSCMRAMTTLADPVHLDELCRHRPAAEPSTHPSAPTQGLQRST